MKKIRDFWVHAHFHVATAAVSLYALYAALTGSKINPLYAGWLFFVTVAYYTFLRLHHRKSLRECLAQWYASHRRLLWVLWLLSLLAAGIFFWFLEKSIQWKIILTGLVAIFYHTDTRPKSILSLRNTGILKILIISLVWASVVAWVPFSPSVSGINRVVLFMHAFLFVLLWTIPFDIRDLALDEGALKTIPLIFKEKTFRYVLLAGMIYWCVTFYLFRLFPGPEAGIFAAGGFLLMAAVYFSRFFGRQYFYTAFWVEGIPIWLYLIYNIIT